VGPSRAGVDLGAQGAPVRIHREALGRSQRSLLWTLEHYATPFLSAGKLVRVLEDWCSPFPGYFLYYPSRRQQPAALSALIDTLRLRKQ
jgi:DNA-binding transcriptional LysR family regulator